MKLTSHLYQVAGDKLSHPYDAAAYLLDGGDALYLIDCGCPNGYEKIVDNIRKAGFNPQDIKAIIATHGHYDHVGAAALFKRDFALPLYLHEADRERVETGDPVKTTAAFLYGCEFPPCKVAGELADGRQFLCKNAVLEIIHTPGHTPGSISAAVKTDGMRILLAGDTLWGGYSEKIDSSEKAWKRSLEKLASYDFDCLSFGHGGPLLYGMANDRIKEAARQFAVYYNPWFKAMKDHFVF